MPSSQAIRAALYSHVPRLAAPLLPGCTARIAGAGRSVFLTFDDGPDETSTPLLLDRLAAHAAHATFFLVGERAARQPGLVRQIVTQGHTIGQHGYAHLDAWRAAPRRIREEMERASGVLEEITGTPVRWARPPYGHLTPGAIRWARRNGQRIALWDLMPADFLPGASAEEVARILTSGARPGGIVVLHDGPRVAGIAAAALDLALPSLAARGFDFPPL